MKRIWVAALFILSIAPIAKAQSIGDLARAERKRQQEITTTSKVMPVSEKPATVETPKAEAAKPEDPKPEPAKVQPVRTEPSHGVELADLQQEKTSLLMKLNDVIRDRKAVQDIEQRLAEILKRTDELKQR